MEKVRETIIGTVLYAASPKSYEVHNLIFTSTRMLAVSVSWRKNNIFRDLVNLLLFALMFPFQGQDINTDTILMRRWSDIKAQNNGKPTLSYETAASQEILDIGLPKMILHRISITPYDMVKKITLLQNPFSEDYRVITNAGFLASSKFLIPDYSLQEFKEFIAKTPLAQKLGE